MDTSKTFIHDTIGINPGADTTASVNSIEASSELDTSHSANGNSSSGKTPNKEAGDVIPRVGNVRRGLLDFPMKASNGSDCDDTCESIEDVEMLEQPGTHNKGNEKTHSNSHERENRQKETLDHLANFLKQYEPKDGLDQDSIDATIVDMNKSAFLRNKRMQILDNHDIDGGITLHHEDGFVWHDNDLYNTEQKNHLHALINVVDVDFFYEIVEAVEAGCVDYILDEDTIKNLRQSLAIQEDGKKRKRRDLKVSAPSRNQNGSMSLILAAKCNTVELGVPVVSSEELNGGKERSVTRGLARNKLNKYMKEHTFSDQSGLEALLGAMIEMERDAGRPTNLAGEIIQPRKLRNRKNLKKHPKYMVDALSSEEIQRLIDDEGREVTRITVGGKKFASPKKRGPKRKRLLCNEGGNQEANEEDHQFSLGLLDWHDRLPLKAKGHGNKPVLPTMKSRVRDQRFAFTEERIDAIITSWEALDNANGLSNEMATLEPPRECHSDEMYGKLCHGLLNCLQSSARIFARHEFFYSDVDRAWFNDNPFHRDLIAHGIDIDTKLSMAEWNAIRRKIRKKKQRKFSRRFIDEEFEKLNEYRKAVRRIQLEIYRGDKPKDSEFPFQVLAPAQVGTTISAYHHKAHLVHRGTVLVHDYSTEAYLIQFEKKSLGYEWCADFEIASHGLPEVIFPLKNEDNHQQLILGKLPTGTNYGPLIEFYNKESQGSSAPIDVSVENIAQVKGEVSKVVHKIAEREALARFMAIVDMLLDRKEALLQTIEECTKAFETVVSDGKVNQPTSNKNDGDSTSIDAQKCQAYSEFKDHLQWLQNNLHVSEKSLQAAMAQLQIIYGKGYTGVPATTHASDTKPQEDNAQILSNVTNQFDDMAFEIGEILATKLCPASEESKDCPTNEYQSCVLSSACSLLVTSDLFLEMTAAKSASTAKVIDAVFYNQLQHLEPESISKLPKVAQDVLDLRRTAFENLQESVAMLSTELLEYSKVDI